ncbi:response regulator [filamentous cyanobacterium LEGE 11480]|uniref:Response regulator n=1 Tax=Romeriopsis navalis LEGE 11480 TaxID=2777977 RepID=A0A928Z3B7_9CYAN|nr:response regulator [Romeriopsis navalis]MBE9029150.1 response regulator [Romeriopsis navalis LEGE 11480]
MKPNAPILLVDDDQIDVMSVKQGLKAIRASNPLYVSTDGEAAIDWLNQGQNPLPALILLDLNMPRMNGFELLQILKADDRWQPIPVVILTTSQDQHDRRRSFQLQAAGYVIKPLEDEDFVEAIRVIHQYWCLSESSES